MGCRPRLLSLASSSVILFSGQRSSSTSAISRMTFVRRRISLRIGEEVTQFPLSGDTSRALSTYQWTYTRKAYKAATLGVNAFNSGLSLNYNSTLTEAISLTYELRGGHDYRLFTGVHSRGLGLMPAPGL